MVALRDDISSSFFLYMPALSHRYSRWPGVQVCLAFTAALGFQKSDSVTKSPSLRPAADTETQSDSPCRRCTLHSSIRVSPTLSCRQVDCSRDLVKTFV